MHTRFTIAFLFYLSVLSLKLQAQGQCNTIPPKSDYLPVSSLPSGARSDETKIIPVLVHIYTVDSFLAITPGQVLEVLDLTNAYLSGANPDSLNIHPNFQPLIDNPNVELRLAKRLPNGECTSGILYYNFELLGLIPEDVSSYTIDSEHYLNIHIAFGSNSFATIPFPNLPPGDPNDFIFLTVYDVRLAQKSLIHEMGHWMGLSHTFGASNVSGVICGDDGIQDTPPTKGGIPSTCVLDLSECTPGVIENVNNHMDYSDCRSMFTIDQVERMEAVLTDTLIPRYQYYQPENLEFTGVFLEEDCPYSVHLTNDQFPQCDSSLIRLFAQYEGIIPDSVEWFCPGATVEYHYNDHPFVYYTTPGLKTAYFTLCKNGVCETFERVFSTVVNQANNNLPYLNLPFSEGFENNFSFPSTHIVQATDDLTPWVVTDITGYNSEHCLFVPAMFNATQDTTTITVGSFDFTGLSNPAVSARVAVSAPQNGSYCIFEIGIREACNNLVPSGVYSVTMLNEMNQGNTVNNFVPSNANQWHYVQTSWPNWSNAANAEVFFRIRYFPLTNGNIPEAFYLDDIRVGELGLITATNSATQAEFEVYPNPAQNQLFVQHANTGKSRIEMYSSIGTLVLSDYLSQDGMLDISEIPQGIYFIRMGNSTKRFVKL